MGGRPFLYFIQAFQGLINFIFLLLKYLFVNISFVERFICLKAEWQRGKQKLPSSAGTLSLPYRNQHWARPQPGGRNPVHVTHVNGRDSSTWANITCLPRHFCSKLDQKWGSQDSNLRSVVWDTSGHCKGQLNLLSATGLCFAGGIASPILHLGRRQQPSHPAYALLPHHQQEWHNSPQTKGKERILECTIYYHHQEKMINSRQKQIWTWSYWKHLLWMVHLAKPHSLHFEKQSVYMSVCVCVTMLGLSPKAATPGEGTI